MSFAGRSFDDSGRNPILRVHFEDDTYKTLSVRDDVTVREVLDKVSLKGNMPRAVSENAVLLLITSDARGVKRARTLREDDRPVAVKAEFFRQLGLVDEGGAGGGGGGGGGGEGGHGRGASRGGRGGDGGLAGGQSFDGGFLPGGDTHSRASSHKGITLTHSSPRHAKSHSGGSGSVAAAAAGAAAMALGEALNSLRLIYKDSRQPHIVGDDYAEAGRGAEVRGGDGGDDGRTLFLNGLGRGERCGYLDLRCESDQLIWYRRWFVLRGEHLWYCKGKEVDARASCSNISLITAVHVAAHPACKQSHDLVHRHCFQIHSGRREYDLRGTSHDDMEGWIVALQVRCAGVVWWRGGVLGRWIERAVWGW